MSGRSNSGEERKYLLRLRPRKREQHDNPDTRREITLSPTRNPTNYVLARVARHSVSSQGLEIPIKQHAYSSLHLLQIYHQVLQS